jgi:hypothetical protein
MKKEIKNEIENKVINTDYVEKQRKMLSITMAISGGLVWLFASSESIFFKYLIQGIGMFLLFFGIASIKRNKPLTKEQIKKFVTFMIILSILVIVSIVIFIL